MENEYKNEEEMCDVPSRTGRVLGGFILMMSGFIWLLQKTQWIDLPYWVFSWEMVVFIISLYIGARKSFSPGGWMAGILFAVFCLTDDWFPQFNFSEYFWPLAVLLTGLFLILTPGKMKRRAIWKNKIKESLSTREGKPSPDGEFEVVAIFAGVKKNLGTSEFHRGEIITFFGGSEINLTQTKLQDGATLTLTNLFGGTKLMVPADWHIKHEIITIMGGVNEKRNNQELLKESGGKQLTIKGTCLFGGVDIKSY